MVVTITLTNVDWPLECIDAASPGILPALLHCAERCAACAAVESSCAVGSCGGGWRLMRC